MKNILVLHGPNLNLLGQREPEIYGHTNLATLNAKLVTLAAELGYQLRAVQSNAEHELIDIVQQNNGQDFIIINPAAFTHTSVALRDALTGTASQFIEVHLSNVYKREPFRHHSYFSDLAIAVICGCGIQGYEFALRAAHHYLNEEK